MRHRTLAAAGEAPAADAAEQVDRLRRGVARQGHRLRHLRRQLAVRAVEHDRVRHPLALRIDQQERHAVERLRAPSRGRSSRSACRVLAVEHAARADDRGRLGQRQRQVLAPLRQELQQVDQVVLGEPASRTLRASATWSTPRARRCRSRRMACRLALGVERCRRPSSSRPRAGRSSDRPALVVTLYWRKLPSTLRLGSRMSMSRWSFGWTAMPVRSGPILPPSPQCVWHLAQCFVNDLLAGRGVAGLLGQRHELVARPSAGRGWAGRRRCASSFLARLASLPVRVREQGLPADRATGR